ncbi:MAG: ribonuclease E/G, partial [Hyphomonas sp.]
LKEAAEEAAAQIEDEDDEDGDGADLDDIDEADNDADDEDSDESEDSSEENGGEAKTASTPRRKKSSRASISKRYKIQEVIRRRQVMLVQVVKEERGNKGAALTTYLSLAGRYSVLMPNTPRGGGISRKIVNGADRKRLKSIVSELDVPDGMGLIVRTAGAKRTKAEIKRDYEYLSKLWENIVEKTLTSEAPMLINAEGGLVHRAMRDMFDKDIEEVLVHGEDAYREAKDLAKLIMPSQSKKVQQWKEEDPLFVAEAVEQQLDSIYSPTVQLKSGGYLVINQTEALVAIDVNSGKSTRERNIEQTALRTNLEAAEEACRQMRLRDLAGLIVIDFIDMDENKNNRAVEKKLKDHLKVDRARVQHGRISQFGLMEISRQRRRQGVLQATSDPCEACNGTGRRRSIPSAALQLIRAIEARASMGGLKAISVKAPTDVALYLLNNKREALVEVERMAGFAVSIHSSEDMLPGDFVIDAERDPNGKPKKRKPPRSLAKPSKQI